MNHIFRIVFNPALRVCQVVSELTSRRGSSSCKCGKTAAESSSYRNLLQVSFRYSTLMVTLFGSGFSLATEYGPINVNDPTGNTQFILTPGDTVNHVGRGPAMMVSQAGNSVTGDKIIVRADATDSGDTVGVLTRTGGSVFLSNSTVETLGDGSKAHALHARDAGSRITGTGMVLSTQGTTSHGAMAQAGGTIVLNGGVITTQGQGSDGLHAKDAKTNITAKNVTISATKYGVYAGPGSSIKLEESKINGKGQSEAAVYASGANTLIALRDTDVISMNGPAVIVQSGVFDMNGGSLTATGDAVRMTSLYNGPSPVANISNASLVSRGDYNYGININSKNARAVLKNVNINVSGPFGTGVWLPSVGTSLTANLFDIRSSYLGVDNRAGTVSLDNGILTTEGSSGHALYVATLANNQASTEAKNVQIETFGASAVGALVRFAGASISLEDVAIKTHGDNAPALYATGNGANLTVLNSTATTVGASAVGLSMSNSPTVSLDNVQLVTKGANSHGIWSYVTSADASNAVTVTNGSRINTQDGFGLLASGGNHTFTLDNSSITARTAGADDQGALLYSRPVSITANGVTREIETGTILLNATKSQLTGDILMDSGSASISLATGSQLTGAINQREHGQVSMLQLDGSSSWQVRNNSSLSTLENAGTLAFLAPEGANGFKTVTVNNYRGNGTLVLNTQLGDDDSPSDRLVIDGGTTEAKTGLRIINAGGVGGRTQRGIRVVETLNGGTTSAEAFRLDAGSTGYRAGTATLAVNGYDYSLVRGGHDGVPEDWYLTSTYTPPVKPPITPPTVAPPPVQPPIQPPVQPPIQPPVQPPIQPPVQPPTVEPPAEMVPPPIVPGMSNVSPESGAYIGNQLAGTRLFIHNLRDRVPVSREGDIVPDEHGLWMRTQGRHDKGMSLVQGNVEMKSDSSLLQLGGDILQRPLGYKGAAYVGVMSGYGEARTYSTSTLMLAGGGHAGAKAKGKMSGYTAGIYATIYEDDATHQGAYADTWLLYGRYSNQIGSELGSTRYYSNVWSASLESGYAMHSFPAGSTLAGLVTEPNAQFVYSDYRASDALLQGTRMRNGADKTWLARVGLRIYPQHETGIRPFLETNVLLQAGKASVQMGSSMLDASLARNMLEMKLGAAGDVGQKFQISGHVFGLAGNHGQQSYGGMLNARYRF
ncbi:autotransporter outer membrane beta-barrel domain-containing protein [Serratia sp. root2]|uniref:autotransporter outer membrane beta-barrel domain-containing protein n=1 Tax=Serratia sp. root2 TaxID=3059676 RepID=UPI00288EC7C8|nr:autotransporter outer membrane beta-barrel domain-containing protein [Serratia sp. root2]MDT3252410.1 autotransporter outer membrane beta-barrel domain-containing protein [Serratia sp. root2]